MPARGRRTPTRQITTRRRDTRDRGRRTTTKPKISTAIPQIYTPAVPTPAPMGISGLINEPQREQPSLSAINQPTAAELASPYNIGTMGLGFGVGAGWPQGIPSFTGVVYPGKGVEALEKAKTWGYQGPTMKEVKAGPWGQLFGGPPVPPPAPSPGTGGYYRRPAGGRSTSRQSVSRAISRGLINWRIGL